LVKTEKINLFLISADPGFVDNTADKNTALLPMWIPVTVCSLTEWNWLDFRKIYKHFFRYPSVQKQLINSHFDETVIPALLQDTCISAILFPEHWKKGGMQPWN